MRLPSLQAESEGLGLALLEDFDSVYVGDTLEALVDELHRDMALIGDPESADYYVQAINIIQSSGLGKSRTVKELSDHIFSLVFMLRRPSDQGFPPGDDNIYEYISDAGLASQNTHPTAFSLVATTLQLSVFEYSQLHDYHFADQNS